MYTLCKPQNKMTKVRPLFIGSKNDIPAVYWGSKKLLPPFIGGNEKSNSCDLSEIKKTYSRRLSGAKLATPTVQRGEKKLLLLFKEDEKSYFFCFIVWQDLIFVSGPVHGKSRNLFGDRDRHFPKPIFHVRTGSDKYFPSLFSGIYTHYPVLPT